jgi:uncharacterized protein YaaQ
MILSADFRMAKRVAKVNGFMIMGFTTELGGITRDRAKELCGTTVASFISENGKTMFILGLESS